MEQLSALKQLESSLSLFSDRVAVLQGKLEDLVFRAQRIANALKNNLKVQDTMFGYDLQNFRREIQRFSNELGGISNVLAGVERAASFQEDAVKNAQAVMRLSDRLSKALKTLHDQALIAHQHIRQSDHKIEAWYLAQEVEEMAQKTQALPTLANKAVIKVSTPPGGS